jgi:WD40 repeat protein
VGGRTLLRDARTGDRTRVELGVPGASLAFSPDGRLLAAAGHEDPDEVRDVRTGRVVARLRTGDFGRSVAFSPDGELLAIGRFGAAHGSCRRAPGSPWGARWTARRHA